MAADEFEYLSVKTLKGVGPAVAEKLKRLEIYTIQDVLFHLPYRYQDRTRLTPIGALQHGQSALVEGVIDFCEIKYTRRSRRSLICHLSDNTGALVLRFFHFNKTQQSNLTKGSRLRCFGEARRGANRLEFVHPEYLHIHNHDDGTDNGVEETLTAIYPKADGIHQSLLIKLTDQVLLKIKQDLLVDWLPEQVINKYGFDDLLTTLLQVHRPSSDHDVQSLNAGGSSAQKRLIFEELLAHQLSLLQARSSIKQSTAKQLSVSGSDYEAFIKTLGLSLTHAQKKVIAEIFSDLDKDEPMLRLVQGDVGSGKTIVAAAAVMAAVKTGCQAAVMAPTEILAEQHYRNFSQWFAEQDCVLLTGKDKGKKRQSKLADIQAGRRQVVIGTHALFQPDVRFENLVLLIVDEQHRFGVHQRLALREKGRTIDTVPHQLIMTATPIPRSLAMTAYADLDYSVIDELPPGRKPVTTVVLANHRREEVVQRIRKACENGEQAYWVCTLVEESEVLQCQAAEVTAEQLGAELKNLRVGLVHGRMKQEQKQQQVNRFKNKEIDLLVATTVIEVGVDVPDASLMIIENAERLGLAQLHQLRGRVGRGSRQSACVLMYQPPLSENGKQRLSILRETNDGFQVAEKDMQLRGPGEILGVRQTGLMQLRIADIVRDEHWFPEVRKTALYIQKQHPEIIKPILRRWLGMADRYINV